ncbi:MAG: HypC/HybG/HupF family hydrogenase formation chaperone [Pirellula sp.]|jgi:hydrogenase expression/formation protein HypC|nr:HypC/HybG/HupF family hydrogenase formation chaperone [Pirellula sp.]
MCLAIPGQVVHWIQKDPPFCQADVVFMGVKRRCNLSFVPEANEGDYVIVHAGVAISIIDAEQAGRILSELQKIEASEDWSGHES